MNLNSKKFLYVEWNSEGKRGGGGVLHVANFINRLVQFCLKEDQGRSLVFSDKWFLNSKTHCPTFIPSIDFRQLYSFNKYAGTCPSGQKIEVFFDEGGHFKNSFISSEQIALFLKQPHRGFKTLRKNNSNYKIFNQYRIEHALKNYNFVFWGCSWTPAPKTRLRSNLFSGRNTDLQTISNRLIKHMNSDYFVVRLRRGDMARSNKMVAKSSQPEFVIKSIRSQFPVGAVIYIMTDGSLSYIKSILKGLRGYKVFHRDRFPIFKKFWKENSFKLYVCELIIYYRAKRALQNRTRKSCKRITSLLSLYKQKKLC